MVEGMTLGGVCRTAVLESKIETTICGRGGLPCFQTGQSVQQKYKDGNREA